jgi:hypothetical protein
MEGLHRWAEQSLAANEASQIDLVFPHESLASEDIRQFVCGGLFELIDNHCMQQAL